MRDTCPDCGSGPAQDLLSGGGGQVGRAWPCGGGIGMGGNMPCPKAGAASKAVKPETASEMARRLLLQEKASLEARLRKVREELSRLE